MMDYFENKIEALMVGGKATPEQTRSVVKMLNDKIMKPFEHEHKDEFWNVMREMHELYEGCHYDEAFAMWEVSQMHHTDKSGILHRGQHWTIEQIDAVCKANRSMFKPKDNVYDVYVALHSWWHDNICQDKIDFGDNAESKNIERGLAYFFADEDAPDGKIWRYYKGMRCNKNL